MNKFTILGPREKVMLGDEQFTPINLWEPVHTEFLGKQVFEVPWNVRRRSDPQVGVPVAESVCAEADRLVSNERNQDYGHPLDDYTRTANIFNAVTGHNITPLDAIKFMICVKLSRQQNKHKRDNLVDACGYIKCLDWATTEQQNRNANNHKQP